MKKRFKILGVISKGPVTTLGVVDSDEEAAAIVMG
jgi:hypothetical protein